MGLALRSVVVSRTQREMKTWQTIRSLFEDAGGDLRERIVAIYLILAAINVGAWIWAGVAFRHYPLLMGTALLAYSFGLRHAVDADHIAAIDNVTRKLMQDGKRPVAVGFMFSLGHSTIVVVGAAAIAGTALALQHRIDGFRNIGSVIGTAGFFVLLICHRHREPDRSAFHLPGLRAGSQRRRVRRRGFRCSAGKPWIPFAAFPSHVQMITRSWHMYPLGICLAWDLIPPRKSAYWDLRGRGLQGAFVLGHPGLPGLIRGRNVPDRYHR